MNLASHLSSQESFYLQHPLKDRSLLSLDRRVLLQRLAIHGAVLLRGFSASIEDFSALVNKITPKTAIDPARQFFAKNVQLVDSGLGAIGLHCENGTTPLQPEVVWFFCERAAISGSQTTLCDGYEVWNHLSGQTKSLFLTNRVSFSRNVPYELWVKYIKHHFLHLSNIENITQAMLDDVFCHIPGAKATLNEDESLFLCHSTFVARSTFFSSSIAFANSLFTPSHNYEAPTILLENGEPIPSWILDECREVTNHLTAEIPWASGDIILIDNTRVMHGRRKITDPHRKIFTALGFLSPNDRKEIL